jgi:hypothetical protein
MELSSGETERSATDSAERVISSVLPDGRVVELLYDASTSRTKLAVWDGNEVTTVSRLELPGGSSLVPFSAKNNLLHHDVVLFPSEAVDYGTHGDLIAAILEYLHQYVDLTPSFERLAAHYALFTWVHDAFNELPYLRLKGDFGTGKTRVLTTLGSICYKPMFASGASTVSPIFHMLDLFRGTLLIDEADFRFSDERAQITKILNNGNARGFPVLRTESPNGREFNPRAFQVFGPKIVAMRANFDDHALESRFITEHTGGRTLRSDIPVNLPPSQATEALALRNKLLMYRFRNRDRLSSADLVLDTKLEPRVRQIYTPLTAVIADDDTRADLVAIAEGFDARIRSERGSSLEAQVATVLRALTISRDTAVLPVKDVTVLFNQGYGAEYGRAATNKWIGGVLRRRLNLITTKSHGNFVVPMSERPKLNELWTRYGVSTEDAEAFVDATGPLPADLDLSWVLEHDADLRA